MARIVTIGAAQSGPNQRNASRAETLDRLICMLRSAKARGCDLAVFTECALTPFFAHWWIEDESELEAYFETEMPGPSTQALFDEAARLEIGFYLGFAELSIEGGRKRRFNSSVLVGPDGQIIGKFRKVHLPGHKEHRPDNPFQNLEKRYFEVGDLGFPTWRAFGGVVGMCICNDRRWPETYRVLALGGAELILLGYNTPTHCPEHSERDHLTGFQHQLSIQAGAYQNSCWVVAVAKAGVEAGVNQLGMTSIIAPSGQIVAQSSTLEDELIIYSCDLDEAKAYRDGVFNFAQNRKPEYYQPITTQTEAILPEGGPKL
jgi:predicted amidohydrolase